MGGKETFTLDEKTLTWKANGKDIAYQGTSDKTPVLLPVVTLTLDGADASFADLKDMTGDAVLTVSYRQQEKLPILAVTVLPLPEKGVTDLELENAAVLSEMGRQALVGWAVPGADETLNLPASFTASFHADHADLNWMMTFSSADPVDTVCSELDERIDLDIHTEMDEVKLLLKAMQNGEALPETTGKTKDIVPKVNELNDGLTQLNDGAVSLADGASTLSTGASTLADGASQLSTGADTLKDGMQTMKDTIVGVEKEAANKLLPYVENELADALRIYEETRDSARNSGYDLRPEDMKTVTVYVIRTDLQ